MRNIVALLLLVAPIPLFAQIGIRAGFNFANVTNASDINTSSRAGFNIGVFLAPGKGKRILGSKTEVIYSRSGYNYSTGNSNGSVNLDYIGLAQLMAIHITKYVEIDIGAQTGYLLNAKVDSSMQSTGNNPYGSILSFYNRFDYGYGGGVEVHPFKGLLIGGRFNISLSNLYKNAYNCSGSGTPPSFAPSIDLKNNVVQLYAGWKF